MNTLLVTFTVLQFFFYCHGFRIDPRVINGLISDVKLFPYYVKIYNQNMSCGGALISDRWVVTAAHCLPLKETLGVFLGVDSVGEFYKKIYVDPSNQYIYPTFGDQILFRDIGLLKLPEQIQQNERVQIAKLTSDCEFDSLERQQKTIGVGLGRTDAYGPPKDARLRHTPLLTMPTSDCLREAKRPLDAFSVICAYMLDGRCVSHGDSGGPLVRENDSALIGVTSYGYLDNPHQKGLQVFSYLPHYYKWISTITGLMLPECGLPQASVL